ncbi:hypothetical protein CLOM_g18059 [Closterium sp. NIES-68]|nr:hypothetical protein CLOM_g18059 [Closterium sp. NIES-68]GJP84893.1 hypothetical protein CLOP_g14940 [Closterium sp. NIES-67]
MACVGAERACVDVDALFSSCWEQDASLTRFVCSMISAPRLAVVRWIRSGKQAAVEVQPVPALHAVTLPVIALLVEAASADAEPETVNDPTEAGKADVAIVTATVSLDTDEAEEVEKPEEEASSFAVAEPENVVASLPSATTRTSVKVAAWLSGKSESEEAQQGVKVGAEASSGWSSMSRSESSCSSHSACLIDLAWDSCSSSSAHSLCSSSSANSLCITPNGLVTELAAVKRGIGRGISSSGKGWCMEVKRFGKAEAGSTFSNQLFGEDDEEEEGEGECGSSSHGLKAFGSGNMCYMNQLYLDEAEEEEREALAASGISVDIGRFGARRRISGSSSWVTLRRMSSVLRQF